jgi:hypothetical protein
LNDLPLIYLSPDSVNERFCAEAQIAAIVSKCQKLEAKRDVAPCELC